MEFCVSSEHLLKVLAYVDTIHLLLCTEQALHACGGTLTHVQTAFQNALSYPNKIPNMFAASQIAILLFLKEVPSLSAHFHLF